MQPLLPLQLVLQFLLRHQVLLLISWPVTLPTTFPSESCYVIAARSESDRPEKHTQLRFSACRIFRDVSQRFPYFLYAFSFYCFFVKAFQPYANIAKSRQKRVRQSVGQPQSVTS